MTTVDQLLSKPDPPRDRWGRYLLRLPGDKKAVGRTRVTTFLKALDSGDGLIAWKATATMVGALRNPGLMAKWAAIFAQSTDPWYANDDLKNKCKKLVDECADHGGAQSRASLGTALHTMVELVARGETPELVEPYKADIDAWLATLLAADLTPLPAWTEVCVYIEKYDLVGTFDGLLAQRGGGLMLSDLKTVTSTDYKALSMAAQLAAYSLATHQIVFPANPDDECTLQPLPDFDRDTGLIVHLPAGEAHCTLHAVDLAQGREALEVAQQMRRLDAQRKRKDTGGLMRPWTPPSPDGGTTGTVVVKPGSDTTTVPTEGPPADQADIALAVTKHAALDTIEQDRIKNWLHEAHDTGHPYGLGGTGNHTTRRLALIEASIAIAQEHWDDNQYRSLIAITSHSPDSFTAPIGALLGTMNHQQAQNLYQSIQRTARTKEQHAF